MIQPTQWKKGLINGSVVRRIAGVLLASPFCDIGKESCARYALSHGIGGAIMLAIPGALIGGSFRKPGSDNHTIP